MADSDLERIIVKLESIEKNLNLIMRVLFGENLTNGMARDITDIKEQIGYGSRRRIVDRVDLLEKIAYVSLGLSVAALSQNAGQIAGALLTIVSRILGQ